MSPTTSLAPRLVMARMKMRSGTAWLDILAVISFALSTLIALTVAGGIWMFHTLNEDRPARILKAIGAENADGMSVYFLLSVVAGALLVVPIFALGSAAVRLAAQTRARRLATLRLIGVTASQTIRMALIETAAQWLIGTIAGIGLYYATLPAWSNVTFFKVPIDIELMMLPLWGISILLVLLLLIATASTVIGLQKVRISPLGVTRRETPRALRAWCFVFFVAAAVAFVVWANMNQSSKTDAGALVTVGALVVLFIGELSLVGPWVIQIVTRPFTATSSVPRLLAVRRILDDPRAVWRSIGGVALLCFVAGFVSTSPGNSDRFQWVVNDVRTGVWITLAFGFVVAAHSSLMNQASLVFERADQTEALSKVGFPFRVFTASRFHQILGPLVVTSVLAAAMGCLLTTSYMQKSPSPESSIQLGSVLGIGFLLTIFSLLMCSPLEKHALASGRRHND